MGKCLLFVVNVDWFFLSHRLPIARKAIEDGYSVHIATTLTRPRTEFERHGIVVHPLEINRSSSSPMSALILAFHLLRIYRSLRPDVLHLVTIKPLLIGGVVARLVRIPAVVSAVSGMGYVYVARGPMAALRRWFVDKLYWVALGHPNQRVIFQNDADAEAVKRIARLPVAKSLLIRGSGVDLDRFTASPVPTGMPVVVMAARLLIDKGVNEFYAAASLLKPRFPTVRFVFVGDLDPGNPASLKRVTLESWVNEGLVEWWGHRSDMPLVLSLASLVVLPSAYGEGVPKVLLEAAACGRAVVTTDIPGCRDAIRPGVTGLIVPARDSEALAHAIASLLLDPARCRAMGAAGRNLAENSFDVQEVVGAHLAIYRDLLHSAGTNRDSAATE